MADSLGSADDARKSGHSVALAPSSAVVDRVAALSSGDAQPAPGRAFASRPMKPAATLLDSVRWPSGRADSHGIKVGGLDGRW